jgi:pimeloyl-ACP methyl ester carboxylesterase
VAVRVELEWREAGAGEALVLLHAFPLNSALWGPQMSMAPRGWRIIAPDLRGFGASPEAPEAVYSMEDMAGDVVGLLDRLDIRRAVICGASMGGYIAFELWRLYPERMRGLILCGTRAGPDSAEAASARERLAQRIEKDGNDVIVAAMLTKLGAPATRHTQKGVFEADRAMMTETPGRTMARALRGMAVRRDAEPLIRTIGVPSLIIVGADDAIMGRDQSEFLARSIRGSTLVTIDDAGHLPPLEQPDDFNKAVRTFLTRLPQVAHA